MTFTLVQSAVISVGLSNLYLWETLKNNGFKCTKKADDTKNNDGFSEKEEN